MVDAICLLWHQLRVGEDGYLRAHSISIVGQIDKLLKLLPIVRPRIDTLSLANGKRHGGDLPAIPSGVITDHRQHSVIVEPFSRKKVEIRFQPGPVMLA